MSRGNVKGIACLDFEHAAVVHCHRRPAGHDQAHVLYIAASLSQSFPDMSGPFPTGSVRGATDGHASDVDDLKFSFFELSRFVGFIESLQDQVKHCNLHGYTESPLR
jgi:hypothetical protein